MDSDHAMKRIFIYGDSNVWGDSFVGSRVRYSDRWVNRLKRELRGKAHIIADGLSGRVAGDFCKVKPYKNGKQAFAKALQRAGNVDIIIIALSTNDLQQQYGRTAQAVIHQHFQLVKTLAQSLRNNQKKYDKKS